MIPSEADDAIQHATLALTLSIINPSKALSEYQIAVSLFRKSYLQGVVSSKYNAAISLYNMGLLYRTTQQPHQSMACFLEAEELVIQASGSGSGKGGGGGGDRLLIQTLQQRAKLHLQTMHPKNTSHAIQCHEQVVTLLLNAPTQLETHTYCARRQQEQRQHQMSDNKRAELLTISLKAIGLLHIQQQNTDEALEALEECLAIVRVRRLGFPTSHDILTLLLDVLLQLSSLYFQKEHFQAVVLAMQETLEIQKERGDDVAYSLNNIGLAYERMGDLANALLYYQQLLQLRRTRRDPIHTAESLVTCAKVLERSRRSHDAMILYHEALAIYQKTPHRFNTVIAEILARTTNATIPNALVAACSHSNSNEMENPMDKVHAFYDLARYYLQQKAHQAAKDCLEECRQQLDTMTWKEIGDFHIRVDALEQMIQNDQVIIATDDESSVPYESLHPAWSHVDELLPSLSSESATQFLSVPITNEDDWTVPPLLVIEHECVEMEHVERILPNPPCLSRKYDMDLAFGDDFSAISAATEYTNTFGGRLGISQRPDHMEHAAKTEGQSIMLQPAILAAKDSVDFLSLQQTKPASNEASLPLTTNHLVSKPNDVADPELTLDMLALLGEESDDDDDDDAHKRENVNKVSDSKTESSSPQLYELSVPPERYPPDDRALSDNSDCIEQDSVDEPPEEDYMGIRQAMKAATMGVTQMLGFIFDDSRKSQSSHFYPETAIDDPKSSANQKDMRTHNNQATSSNHIDSSSKEIHVCKGNSIETGLNLRNRQKLTDIDENYESSVETSDSDNDFSDSEVDSQFSDADSQFSSDEDGTCADSDTESEAGQENSDSDGIDSTSGSDADYGIDAPIDSLLGSSGVLEEDVDWNDEESRRGRDLFIDPHFACKEPEERDDVFGHVNVVTIEMDHHAVKAYKDVKADKASCAAADASSSPTGVIEWKAQRQSPQKDKASPDGKHAPRNRVAKAISNTFKRVRKGNSRNLVFGTEEETRVESALRRFDVSDSNTSVESEDFTSMGPIEVLKLRDRSKSCDDSISQLTFPREEQSQQCRHEHDYIDDNQWWWGATVSGFEDTLYLAQALAETANDFFSAKSIHDQNLERLVINSHRSSLDNDEKTEIFGSMSDEPKLFHDVLESTTEINTNLVSNEGQKHGGPNLEMIAQEVDNMKWEPPKASISVRGLRVKAGSPQAQNRKVKASEKALEHLKLKHGYYSLEVARAMVALGKLQLEAGDSENSTARILEALKIQKFIANPREMTRSLNVLSEIYSVQQEFDQALACCKDTQRLERRMYGPDHPENACTLNRMGRIYANLGDFSLAMEKHQQALQVLKGCFGENLRHPAVSQTLIHIGEVYYRERNSFDMIRSNVDDYGSFIESGMLDVIALAHEDRGSVKMALCFLEEKLQVMRDKKSSYTAVDLVATLYSLGKLSSKAGVYWEAISYYEQALGIQRKQGCTNVQLACAKVLIGTVESHLGQYKKALGLLNSAHATLKIEHGDNNELVADSLQRIGFVKAKLYDFKGAMSHLNQALNVQKEILGLEDPSTLRTQLEIGISLLELNRVNEAVAIFQMYKSTNENIYGRKHPDIADALHFLGVACKLQGDYDKAMDLFKESFHMRVRFLGRDHPAQASTLHEVVLLTLKKNQVRKALSMCSSVLAVRKGTLGERHLDVALTISSLGQCQTMLGNFGASIKAFSEALPMAVEAVGPKHPAVGDIYVDKAMLHLKKCEFDEAERSVSVGLDIFKCANVPENHPRCVHALKLLEKIHRDEMLCV